MKSIIQILLLFITSTTIGQSITKHALFLGNSYTAVNNLPQMVSDVANSTGDTLIFDSNTPGGYTLQQHSTNITSLAKIAVGTWDYVVLQEQSQLPSFPIGQVDTLVFPYAHYLDSIIKAENTCGETVFYMTWGYENGDSSNCTTWPPVCTYSGMDSLLNLRYRMMADSNNALLSPVGAVRHYIRQNFPLIQLYQADHSHPTVAGTYAAACCFYTTFYRKDPTLITFNSTLPAGDAANIRTAAKLIVFDSLLNWNIGLFDLLANFTSNITGNNQVTFTNTSTNATTYNWYFGDGDTSTLSNPVHTYAGPGTYNVMLIASKCGITDTFALSINITPFAILTPSGNQKSTWSIYPNPITTSITLIGNFYNPITYRIFDITGSEIQSGVVDNSKKQIQVTSLQSGLYLLQLSENNKQSTQQKFIKLSN